MQNMSNSNFYDVLADNYNQMIPLENQVQNKIEFLKKIVDKSAKTAADIGCGSGPDSLALSQLGLKVTSFDPSNQMLVQAKINSEKLGINLDLHKYSTVEIPDKFNKSFDLVVSLGNTFANIPFDEIDKSLNKIHEILLANGKLLIQILNYSKILDDEERIVNITQSGTKYFVRFYDFMQDQLRFNVLSFEKDNPNKKQLITTEIYPYTKSVLEDKLLHAGFTDLKFFGNTKYHSFIEKDSENLIISAVKED